DGTLRQRSQDSQNARRGEFRARSHGSLPLCFLSAARSYVLLPDRRKLMSSCGRGPGARWRSGREASAKLVAAPTSPFAADDDARRWRPVVGHEERGRERLARVHPILLEIGDAFGGEEA